jgi:hypothetical protein
VRTTYNQSIDNILGAADLIVQDEKQGVKQGARNAIKDGTKKAHARWAFICS